MVDVREEPCPTTSSGCGPTWRPVGRSAASGGYFRQPFTSAERELDAWFGEQARARGLRVETDEIGNVIAWWDADGGPAVLTGSHLDSVLDGGAYDGPLGVVSALAAVDALRERGFVPSRPIGVSVFVEEEGSRFGLACLGSRLATGAVTWEKARELRDRDGVAFGDVVAGGSAVVARRCRHLRRAARGAGPRPGRPRRRRSGWPARSGRTGATGSTSPVRRTTPAPPGWRTAPTRC